jgi:hypothetical protein
MVLPHSVPAGSLLSVHLTCHTLRTSTQRGQSPECHRRLRSAAVTSETRTSNGQLRLPWQSCFKLVQARSRRTIICETDRSFSLSQSPASVRSLMYCHVLNTRQHRRRRNSGSCWIQCVSLSVGTVEVEGSECSIVKIPVSYASAATETSMSRRAFCFSCLISCVSSAAKSQYLFKVLQRRMIRFTVPFLFANTTLHSTPIFVEAGR